VIIGGGFGGLAAANVLRHEPVRVTLLDRHNYHLFQPLLYQVATATLSPGDIASPIRWIFRHAPNVRVLLAEAESIDLAGRQVRLKEGLGAGAVRGSGPPSQHWPVGSRSDPSEAKAAPPIGYDYLIVATGSSHSYFGQNDWARHAPGLKTLEDALEIRRRILLAFERAERETDAARRQELLTFVLIGGGPTGVELAGTLAEIARQTLRDEFRSIDPRQARIVLIEAGDTILPSFPPKLRDAARASLARLGVEVREQTKVTAVDEHGVMAGSERLVAGTVLWAAGVTASPLIRSLGVPLDRVGRAIVEPDLSISGHPEVFVVGDAAVFLQSGRGATRQASAGWRSAIADRPGAPLPGVAQVAIQQAAHAARTIANRERDVPTAPFRFRDKGSMAIVGRRSALVDLGWIAFSGTLAWLAWLFLHIFMLIGFRNRFVVLLQWGVAYFTYQRSVRLITNIDRSERS
jgi:NADH dehydrogenase